MCRIDAPFGLLHLDEKTDPKERFLQALDESGVKDDFRELLTKHFSDIWNGVFSEVSDLEKALSVAMQQDSDSEKCIAILQILESRSVFNVYSQSEMLASSPMQQAMPGFVRDILEKYYVDSTYSLYIAGTEHRCTDYIQFVSWLHGKDYCFTKAFFDDSELNLMSEARRETFLWRCFDSFDSYFDSYDDNKLVEVLVEIASSKSNEESLSKASSRILRCFDFLRAWIKFDSQSGRLSYNWVSFIHHPFSPWERFYKVIHGHKSKDDKTHHILNEWFETTFLELEKLTFVSADLSSCSCEQLSDWARGVEAYFSHLYRYVDMKDAEIKLTTEELNLRYINTLNNFCRELRPLQLSTWVKYSITTDFERIIINKINLHHLPSQTEKWIHSEHSNIWKTQVLDFLTTLSIEDRLRILSIRIPYSEQLFEQITSWWDELFLQLVKQSDFPKTLTPDWAIATEFRRISVEDVLPHIDNSVGIIRGALMKMEVADDVEKYHQQLSNLLNRLDELSPQKALRHRLLLMRSSNVPVSDETLSKNRHLYEKNGLSHWELSLVEVLTKHQFSQVNREKEQIEFYISFSNELAEFFLSRLRLKKGEHVKEEQYESHQVIEQSSVWRQGYLKALIELGFDLNGRVHKIAYFIKTADPDEGVRAIASECYKAIRRKNKKNSTLTDLKRGIIAAEWWLLLCQRQELNHDINYEEALKTRRRLMRNS